MTGNPFRGGAQVDSYAYPAGSNRLASVALAAGGTRNLGYDAAGNVISDSRAGGPYGYSYDAAGRLASVTVGGVVQAEYKYNALGQQAVRTFPGSGRLPGLGRPGFPPVPARPGSGMSQRAARYFCQPLQL